MLGLTEVLNKAGHAVVGIAPTVNDAARLAATTNPDGALMDIRLGGQRDGVEGAQLLREQFGIPVVFLTAQADAIAATHGRHRRPCSRLP